MKNIAIITARGGSKRIPRKNIKEFCGRPIISYPIEAAKKSGIFDKVMVSTDDAEIAEISTKYGAEIPFFRSAETSNDYAVTADVIKEVLMNYKKLKMEFDYFCCLYPTAPFITAERLKDAMNTLISSKVESLLPVVRFSFPPQRCIVIHEGKATMKWPEYLNTRSQDLEPFYHDCGQFYAMKTEVFFKEQKLVTENTIPFIMPEIEVQDIDTPEDWALAELKFKYLNKFDS